MSHLITPQEAAELLGGSKPIPISTLAYRRTIGYGPVYITLGCTYRYLITSLTQFLEQGLKSEECAK